VNEKGNKRARKVNAVLVRAKQVSDVNLKPPDTPLAQWLALVKEQEATALIRSNVVKVRGNGVRAPAKIDIVREVNGVSTELVRKE